MSAATIQPEQTPAYRQPVDDVSAALGTDVSKEAADIVLADDNFASIVAAVASSALWPRELSKAVTRATGRDAAA